MIEMSKINEGVWESGQYSQDKAFVKRSAGEVESNLDGEKKAIMQEVLKRTKQEAKQMDLHKEKRVA